MTDAKTKTNFTRKKEGITVMTVHELLSHLKRRWIKLFRKPVVLGFEHGLSCAPIYCNCPYCDGSTDDVRRHQEYEEHTLQYDSSLPSYAYVGTSAQRCNYCSFFFFSANPRDVCPNCGVLTINTLNDTLGNMPPEQPKQDVYTNGAYGDIRIDPNWNKQVADMGMGTVVAGLHTNAQSMHQRMMQEQEAARRVGEQMLQDQRDRNAPPQTKVAILGTLNKLVKKVEEIPPIEEAPPRLRRIKI